MSRVVRVFEPTWQDRHFRKALEKLRAEERKQRAGQVAALVKVLRVCANPVTDPALQAWRPSSYRGVIQLKGGGQLVEYRFPGVMRVIACCFDSSGEPRRSLVLLLTITLEHDHERMKRLLRQNVGEISEEGLSFLEGREPDPR